LENFLNVLAFVGFTVDDSCGKLALKHFKDVQGVARIKEVNELVGNLENEFSFSTWCYFDSPQLGVLDGRQIDVPAHVFVLVFLGDFLCFDIDFLLLHDLSQLLIVKVLVLFHHLIHH
jgi:hypothetical protein